MIYFIKKFNAFYKSFTLDFKLMKLLTTYVVITITRSYYCFAIPSHASVLSTKITMNAQLFKA